MVKVTKDAKGQQLPCTLTLDNYLKKSMDILEGYVQRNWDSVGIIVGGEGDGKSTLAQQLGLYLDANLTINNIVFDEQQFSEAVENSPKGSCIIWDEADALASHWATKLYRALTTYLKRIRSKNLHIMFVTPTYFDLGWYFAVSRSRYLIHVHSKGYSRGYIRFFNSKRKEILFNEGKQKKNMRPKGAAPNFICRFVNLPDEFPVGNEEYDEKKDQSTQAILENDNKSQKDSNVKVVRVLSKYVNERWNNSIPQSVYAEALGVTQASISRYMKEM